MRQKPTTQQNTLEISKHLSVDATLAVEFVKMQKLVRFGYTTGPYLHWGRGGTRLLVLRRLHKFYHKTRVSAKWILKAFQLLGGFIPETPHRKY